MNITLMLLSILTMLVGTMTIFVEIHRREISYIKLEIKGDQFKVPCWFILIILGVIACLVGIMI